MADIKAVALLKAEISNANGITDPPINYDESAHYKQIVDTVVNKALATNKKVNEYVTAIHENQEELSNALKGSTTKIQKAIHKALDFIKGYQTPITFGRRHVGSENLPSNGNRQLPSIGKGQLPSNGNGQLQSNGNGQLTVNILKFAKDLGQVAQIIQRLDEFVQETENVIAKIHNTSNCIDNDVESLKGYLNNWENYEDEKRKLEEEKRKKGEEAERRKREKEERKRIEEEEQRKREEEKERRRQAEEEAREAERQAVLEAERLKREEKEKKRREEATRKKREEEKRIKAEEEAREAERQAKLEAERLKIEEEDRLKREEKEIRLKEEQERIMREEIEKKRRTEEKEAHKEAERKRKEEERLEKEKREKEEEARRKRLDPNNWEPFVYDRDVDCVDGNTSYHKGVCCVLTTPLESITKEDVECLASDEDNSAIDTLEDGEKIASSVIEITSTQGTVKTEAPVRAYIPHFPVTDPGDEIVVKISVNGRDWQTVTPEQPTSNVFTEDNIKLIGVQLDDFDQAKIVVIARRKSQTIIVDRKGTSQYSTYDKNVKLFVPRDAFSDPTELKLAIRPITEDTMSSICTDSDSPDSIISTSSVITLSCQKPPTKDIEIDLMRPILPSGKIANKGKLHQLYRTKENVWRVAEAEYRGRHNDVSVMLPAYKEKYTLIEIETQQHMSREDVLRVAESIYDVAHKTVVRFILKQKQTQPELAMVHCVRKEMVTQRLAELEQMKYTLGADVSREFCLKDGQKLKITCSGNIDTSTGTDGQNMLTFYTYMDSARQEIILQVKDKYKQRDLAEYLGSLKCEVQTERPVDDRHMWATGTTIEMPISLPKIEQIRRNIKSARVQFPPYLTALTGFLSWKLTNRKEMTIDWLDVVMKLDENRKIQTLVRMAKNKCDQNDNRAICRSVITDWMKAKPCQDDKMKPIHRMLLAFGLHGLNKQCEDIVEFHKDHMSDTKMVELSERIPGDPREIGEKLHLPNKDIERCMTDNPGSSSDQIVDLLMEWRHSDDALFAGTDALKHLQKLLS